MVNAVTDWDGTAPLGRLTDSRQSATATPETKQALERFLASAERRARYMARIATGNDEDALDIVQDTMLELVRRYSNRPAEQWRPLFFTILGSRITDWHRRQSVRNRWRLCLDKLGLDNSGEAGTGIDQLPDPQGRQPWQELHREDGLGRLGKAVEKLPLRQQQAFLLRAWEGLSVAETAAAMGCSAGSVKTHYSRATHSLRASLEEYVP
ncbi:RNA polymerase sigma factor [Exilibacterium tricleocarpae]|uniref:RNA polymerase sigma factor n=1 Tax=Exilibacterium tricleocarpae TaxID=2591008 RepID=A0A545U9X8_9GAMM|nr:RNA polymerase sigma factor [Exilibacterium tricleocarpae]TQV86278.1 RNA polymerase sigma factor [Exilibacterium tricleocarpae]